MLTVGIFGTSLKENEHRVPVHPGHFDRIAPSLRAQLLFEKNYGQPFGITDAHIEREFGGIRSRSGLFETCDVAILPKPLPQDLGELREGGVLWGWPHCVQQQDITQAAVDRKQTLIAWEAMFQWKADGARDMHLFYRNNEMAGYCGVLHALELMGMDGFYGPTLNAVVLSFGSVSRGAIHALRGRGVTDISVFTQRPATQVHDRIVGCRYGHLLREGKERRLSGITDEGKQVDFVDVLAKADIIVNGILQDTDDVLMFLHEGEEQRLKQGTLIVDGSCDAGMGFPFARPTSFADPVFRIGSAMYYAVDHTPSYLWRSASWEISEVVVPYLETVVKGPQAWERNETIRRAIEIRNGVVQNPKILSFGRRAPKYPHEVLTGP